MAAPTRSPSVAAGRVERERHPTSRPRSRHWRRASTVWPAPTPAAHAAARADVRAGAAGRGAGRDRRARAPARWGGSARRRLGRGVHRPLAAAAVAAHTGETAYDALRGRSQLRRGELAPYGRGPSGTRRRSGRRWPALRQFPDRPPARTSVRRRRSRRSRRRHGRAGPPRRPPSAHSVPSARRQTTGPRREPEEARGGSRAAAASPASGRGHEDVDRHPRADRRRAPAAWRREPRRPGRARRGHVAAVKKTASRPARRSQGRGSAPSGTIVPRAL
jgi:hypothetical protein